MAQLSGKAHDAALRKLSGRSARTARSDIHPGAQPKVGVGGTAGGITTLKPQGRQAPTVKTPRTTGKQFPGSTKGGTSTSGRKSSPNYK
jgi:hypothetical protein